MTKDIVTDIKTGYSASSPASNKLPKTRVSGVILIDKPKGLTSQQVVSKIKYLLKSQVHDSKKAGHTGTLDPMATGLLPVCLGEATKFSHYQLDADKSYQAVIKLGQQTDTGDAEGQIMAETVVPQLTQSLLSSVTEQFLGAIEQIPPMYSALKKDGKKLYEYARAGIEVKREPRPITIKSLSLYSGQHSDEVIVEVRCTKGTYVRVLGEDIAKALGTLGHLTMLRRTQVGHFDITAAITLDALESLPHEQRLATLLPIDACITDLPTLMISESQSARLHMGQRLNVMSQFDEIITTAFESVTINGSNDNTSHNHIDHNHTDHNHTSHEPISIDIKLVDAYGQFMGLGQLESNGRLQPKKMIQR